MKSNLTFFRKKAGRWLGCSLGMLCGLLVLNACHKDNLAADPIDEGSGELKIGAGIQVLTRALETGFEQNDSIALYAVRWKSENERDSLLPQGNYCDNVCFRLADLPDSWVTAAPVYFPADNRKLDLYAYYPYRAPAFEGSTTIALAVATDQTKGKNYTRSDFMVAGTNEVVRTSNKVPLIFTHKLSQMVFELVPGTGFLPEDLLNAQITIVNALTEATYDLRKASDAVPAARSKRENILPAGRWEKNGNKLTGKMAIVVPQDIDNNTYIQLSFGNRRFTYKPGTPVSLESGYSKTFTITVNNNGLSVTTVILPWNTSQPATGTAEEEFAQIPIVTMVSAKQTISFSAGASDSIRVDWGDGTREINVFTHTYSDKTPHTITLWGTSSTLNSFYCENNELLALQVTNNTSLKSLSCGKNRLTSLKISEAPALQSLRCQENNLPDLNQCEAPLLDTLHCNNNRLKQLDPERFPQLKTLLCHNNQLDSLNTASNKNLVIIRCSENSIQSLDFSRNLEIQHIVCHSNLLTELLLPSTTTLRGIACKDNRLTSLYISGYPELSQLFIEGNPFYQDVTIRNQIINSLPDRTGKEAGNIDVRRNSICEAKNWRCLGLN